MTVETYTPTTTTLSVAPAIDLERFAVDAAGVMTIAKGIANTSFVPKAMQGKPAEITAAILFGRELGIDPMISLQTIHVIEGRPAMSANAMRGLAQAAGVKFRLDEANDTRVVMSAMAPGDDGWTTVNWTLDRAKKMGLMNKSNWAKMPQDMMVARCTAQLCRLTASNVLIGMPYSTEEMQDADAPVYNPPETLPDNQAPTVKAVATKAIKREPIRPTVSPEVVNALQEELPPKNHDGSGYNKADVPQRPVGEVIERPNGITLKTRTAVMATFNDMNVKDRNARLAKVTEIVGRDIYSVNMLSEDEGRQVLTVLQAGRSWDEEASA